MKNLKDKIKDVIGTPQIAGMLERCYDYFISQLQKEHEATCPLCKETHRVYERPLNNAMVGALVFLGRVRRDEGDKWVHVSSEAPKQLVASSEHSKLRYWDLIEPQPPDEDSKNRGMWRITDKGMRFLNGQISVPESILLLNGDLVGYGTETVTFKDKVNEAGSDIKAYVGSRAVTTDSQAVETGGK